MKITELIYSDGIVQSVNIKKDILVIRFLDYSSKIFEIKFFGLLEFQASSSILGFTIESGKLNEMLGVKTFTLKDDDDAFLTVKFTGNQDPQISTK